MNDSSTPGDAARMSTGESAGPGSAQLPFDLSRNRQTLFLVGFLVLFLELACIRWFGAYVVFLQFFTNIILIACFLGMSVGCVCASSKTDWLKRRPECGNPCQICTHSCPIGAIDPAGAINMNECLQCLDCQVDYFDDRLCPPLVVRRRKIENCTPAPVGV